MRFSTGDRLCIENEIYDVIGFIQYKNITDGCTWVEYRLKSYSGAERWLSYDEDYREYSLSEIKRGASVNGYHKVDSGIEEVLNAGGSVDVVRGDRASFIEYEDSSEEYIVSVEIWDDGEERSAGYYLDENEVQKVGGVGTDSGINSNGANVYTPEGTVSDFPKKLATAAVIIFFVFGFMVNSGVLSAFSNRSIAKYLKKTVKYTYVTSITAQNKQKADVYKASASMTLDDTVKDIINGIDGNTENVQQNTEGDDSVAILTSKEYCLVYTAESGETLVQISSRRYAYGSDSSPYRSTSHTHRFYRRYYYTRGYSGDRTRYGKDSSPYTSYSGTTVDTSASDAYNTYSSSVRQASARARTSSGGGTSSGK